ncbi:helix-turn-helix transcriptional regulator [Streptococcus suis]|uniref:helix-turn-helix domain-containing protein n=1 Tax=Streptococcus parasuis TaxID=1501662 RepID=UPI0015561224|nr:helix-turn-helix transcriptional regulator [Streptococcus suis]NQK66973.1 helix-turn-helix transcriptional regulator [Streptococcus suis]NQP54617.1 helix-turn-helix transcriptional regulator [Streptococcus suis]WNF86321.1 helix-turn-helix domain-containing protein [Streptococcus parasuis]
MVNIADKLKTKRKEYGLSQSELAEGICEQSQISKIERGNYMPTAILLHKLASRLNVTIDYFFDEQIESVSNLKEFMRLSSRLLEDRNYKDLEYLYNLEKEKQSFLSLDEVAYLTWIHAIILFYTYNEKDKAIALLEKSMTSVSEKHSVYLKILNTLANFYSLVGRDEEYERNYKKLIQLYSEKDFDSQEFLFGYIRTRYNYAHHLLSKNQTTDAIQIAIETIEVCKEFQTSYQLAPLLIIVANGSEEFLDSDEVTNYYIDARDLSRIYGNKLMHLQIEKYMNDSTK